MQKRWVVSLVQGLPQGLMSRAWGWMARRQRPRLGVHLLKRTFVAATGIDMAEALEGIESYPTLESLFVRELAAGARPIDSAADAVVSPVDAQVGACGTVEDGTLLQVKGRHYGLARLLGSEDEARRFEGGTYVTLYLSPSDYHRIHAPVAGEVRAAQLIPGGLLPVFPLALESVEELFARNERLITYLDSPEAGRVAVAKVGATLVGRITVTYDPEIQTNRPRAAPSAHSYEPPAPFAKGDELGAFELGSTVVLVMEPGRVSVADGVEGEHVRMGQRIGTIAPRSKSQGGRQKKQAARRGASASKGERGASGEGKSV